MTTGRTSRRFAATVLRPDGGPGHAIQLPFDPLVVFGRARAAVRVTIDGRPAFRTTLASYGGRGWIGLRKAQLTELRLGVGDEVTVTVEVDGAPREVPIPPELTSALAAHPTAQAAFASLPPSHRREYAGWVSDAKRTDTRQRRAAATATKLVESQQGRAGAAPADPRPAD